MALLFISLYLRHHEKHCFKFTLVPTTFGRNMDHVGMYNHVLLKHVLRGKIITVHFFLWDGRWLTCSFQKRGLILAFLEIRVFLKHFPYLNWKIGSKHSLISELGKSRKRNSTPIEKHGSKS